jgi:hypothetical protein
VTASGSASHLTATRWWSNSADSSGSKIDMAHPAAAAGKLHPSETEYCAMLEQTVAAQKSILPGVTAKDPALLASAEAFVAEIQAVAPSSVAASWKVLGTAVTAIVSSGGDLTKVKDLDAAAVQKASTAIAADAKSSCGVNLSSATS